MTSIPSALCMVMNVVSRTFLSVYGPAGLDQVATHSGALLPQAGFSQNLNWAFQKNATSGYYKTFNAYHPSYLGMNSTAPGSSIYTLPYDSPADELTWSIIPHATFQKPTYYTLVNKYSGLVAEVVSTQDGAAIAGNTPVNGKPSQAWVFICE